MRGFGLTASKPRQLRAKFGKLGLGPFSAGLSSFSVGLSPFSAGTFDLGRLASGGDWRLTDCPSPRIMEIKPFSVGDQMNRRKYFRR